MYQPGLAYRFNFTDTDITDIGKSWISCTLVHIKVDKNKKSNLAAIHLKKAMYFWEQAGSIQLPE